MSIAWQSAEVLDEAGAVGTASDSLSRPAHTVLPLPASAHLPSMGTSLAPAPGRCSSIALSLAISRSARIRP